MEFAERLKQLMEENSVSNYELAKKTETHPTTVANWLSGSVPQPRKLKAIADYFNVSIDYIQGKTDIKKDLGKTEVSDMDSLFLNGMHQLSPEDQLAVLAYIHSLRNK